MTTKNATGFNTEPIILVSIRGRKVRVIYSEHEKIGYCWNFLARDSEAMMDAMTWAEYSAVYSQICRHAERHGR